MAAQGFDITTPKAKEFFQKALIVYSVAFPAIVNVSNTAGIVVNPSTFNVAPD